MSVHIKLLQSCPTLCDPMDYSSLGYSDHGILQARILEWIAMPSCKGSSRPRNQIRVSYVSFIGGQVLYRQYHLYNLFLISNSFLLISLKGNQYYYFIFIDSRKRIDHVILKSPAILPVRMLNGRKEEQSSKCQPLKSAKWEAQGRSRERTMQRFSGQSLHELISFSPFYAYRWYLNFGQ